MKVSPLLISNTLLPVSMEREDRARFSTVFTPKENTPEWPRERIDEAIASGKTVKADLAEPVPVYITYFTAAAIADKNEIIAYKDIYGRDAPVKVALNDRNGTATLASIGN